VVVAAGRLVVQAVSVQASAVGLAVTVMEMAAEKPLSGVMARAKGVGVAPPSMEAVAGVTARVKSGFPEAMTLGEAGVDCQGPQPVSMQVMARQMAASHAWDAGNLIGGGDRLPPIEGMGYGSTVTRGPRAWRRSGVS